MPGIIYVTDAVPRDRNFMASLPEVLAKAANERLGERQRPLDGEVEDVTFTQAD